MDENSFLHYQLKERIGQGSNAVVYKAINKKTGQVCALKLFLCKEQAEGESHFLKEFEFAKSLIHPNIVKIHSGGVIDEMPYIEQELVEGIDLGEYLERYKKMPVNDSFVVASEICSALDYVWSNYLAIHRDVKPQNILIDDEGNVKICDFGMVNEHGEWFDDRKIEGTPFYLSPESVRGDYQDNRSDLYALGVTIFHMIAGEPPFDDQSLKKTIYSRIEDQVPSVRAYDSSISESVARVLQVMMASNADHRYLTAFECMEDLQRVLEGRKPVLVDLNRPHING